MSHLYTLMFSEAWLVRGCIGMGHWEWDWDSWEMSLGLWEWDWNWDIWNGSTSSFCLPSSKLTGMAFRVPVPDVSVVDLTCRLKKPVCCVPNKSSSLVDGEYIGTKQSPLPVSSPPLPSPPHAYPYSLPLPPPPPPPPHPSGQLRRHQEDDEGGI